MFNDFRSVRSALLHGIQERSFLVVGDVMIDRYLSGPSERISPEAPVPVVQVRNKKSSLGGAANVARNLAALAARVELAGFVGQDAAADEAIELLTEAGIGSNAILKTTDYCTIAKTRVLAGDHQLVRLDEETKRQMTEVESDQLITAISALFEAHVYDAVILSDYAKGVCTPYLCQALIQLCKGKGIPVYVDPKGTDCRKYHGATAVKPNRAEMALLAQAEGWDRQSLVEAADEMRRLLELDFVVLTLGPDGMVIVGRVENTKIPTAAQEVFDVAGAGDAVLAAMVAGLACGLTIQDSASLGTLSAAQVTARVGCVPVERAGLILSVQSTNRFGSAGKLYDLDDLKVAVDAWKSSGQRVALTNGCFDLLHAGHVRMLEDAASKSDRLIVALNSDESIRRLKGDGRPLMPQRHRCEVLAAMASVDALVVFEQDTPIEVVEAIRPDFLIKGADYEAKQIVGANLVESYGGTVLLIPLAPGLSSSKLQEAIDAL